MTRQPAQHGAARADHLDGPDAGTGEDATPRYSPVCTYCFWWKPSDGRSCAAFRAKNSIPLGIWASQGAGVPRNGFNHLRPVSGDHGIVFELAPRTKAPRWLSSAEDKAGVTAKRH